MKHPDIPTAAREMAVELSARQVDQLEAFQTLLVERAIPLGLVAAGDEARIRERHILDCLRAAPIVTAADAAAYDLGSGAGLPGLVVAIAHPPLQVTLVESRRRRGAFLELAVDALGLGNVRVHVGRVEDLAERVDLCFARAFAPLPGAWGVARRLLRPGGRLVYFAGSAVEPGELPELGAWTIRVTPVLESSGPLVIMSRQ